MNFIEQKNLENLITKFSNTDSSVIKKNLIRVIDASQYNRSNQMLADKVGVSVQTIYLYRQPNKQTNISFDVVLRLANALGVKIKDLIGRKEGINMKRLLMLKPRECASGDTKVGKIYNITGDKLSVWDKETDDGTQYEYNQENVEKYPNGVRWVEIDDESSSDSFDVDDNDDRFIIFENDKELAHELINRMDGLDKTIVNMAMMFMKDK